MNAIPNEPELLSLVLLLRPAAAAEDRAAPAWWGRAAHQLLLQIIAAADSELAASLHEGSGMRPFTASSLLGRFPARRVAADETYTLRLTAIRGDVARVLLRSSLPGGPLAAGAPIELDRQPFVVQEGALSPDVHPWAAADTYAGLAAARLVGSDPAARQISLLLTSPTSFRSQERHVPIPLPGLTFGSLLERWNAYAAIAFPAEVRRYADECLAVSRYELATRPVPGKEGGLRVGAVGRITYVTLNYDRYWMGILHALAAFALYAGVGVGTTTGLGQCRAEGPEPVQPED